MVFSLECFLVSFCIVHCEEIPFPLRMQIIVCYKCQPFRKYSFVLFCFLMYFLAVLGLHCCTWAFSSCGEQGLLFVAVCGLLIAVASLVAEHGL